MNHSLYSIFPSFAYNQNDYMNEKMELNHCNILDKATSLVIKDFSSRDSERLKSEFPTVHQKLQEEPENFFLQCLPMWSFSLILEKNI